MFVDGFRLAMVGMNNAAPASTSALHNLNRLDQTSRKMATGGEGIWTWLSRYWGPIPVTTGKIQDEWAPVIEYRLPGARYNGDLDLAAILDWLLSVRPRLPESVELLSVDEENRKQFDDAYMATDLAYQRWLAILKNRPGEHLLPLAYQANPKDRWIGFALADGVLADREAAKKRGLDDRQLYEMVLKIRPDHTEALRGLWHLSQVEGDGAMATSYRARLQALSPLDNELRLRH